MPFASGEFLRTFPLIRAKRSFTPTMRHVLTRTGGEILSRWHWFEMR